MRFYLMLDNEIATTQLFLQPTREIEEASKTEDSASSITIGATVLSKLPPPVVGEDLDTLALVDKPERAAVTTAEAIAAELVTIAATLPEPSMVTYAPNVLYPGCIRLPSRRKPGQNLQVFRSMAAELFKN